MIILIKVSILAKYTMYRPPHRYAVFGKISELKPFLMMHKNNLQAVREGKNPDILVPERGVEPPTFSLRMSCSTD